MRTVSFDVGMKNLAYCIVENRKILAWKVLDLHFRSNEDLCKRVVATLDDYPEILNVDAVVIEKQPSKNNKMRIVESLLNAYFIIKGTNCDESPISKVCVYSSKHKLGATNLRGKTNYRERKKLAMTRCSEFLRQTSDVQTVEFIALFSASKKKDDLADSLLQALSYVGDDVIKSIASVDLDTICKIVARKPTARQEAKMYSKSNLKYLFDHHGLTTVEEAQAFTDANPKVKKAIYHWYLQGGVQKAMRELSK